MSQPINIGIVGLGFMAATHIRAYRQVEGARVADNSFAKKAVELLAR